MHDEKIIVSRIKGGDMAAFRILVKQYERLVLYMVNKLVQDKEDIEDICQEVFIKVYQNISKFKFESKLSTWIAQIAYRTSINHLKKYHKFQNKQQDLFSIENVSQTEDNPEQDFTKKETHAYINDLIGKLPEQYKIVLTLYHFNEFSYQEIEEITKMPEGTVKNYLYRARKILKEKLEDYLRKEIA